MNQDTGWLPISPPGPHGLHVFRSEDGHGFISVLPAFLSGIMRALIHWLLNPWDAVPKVLWLSSWFSLWVPCIWSLSNVDATGKSCSHISGIRVLFTPHCLRPSRTPPSPTSAMTPSPVIVQNLPASYLCKQLVYPSMLPFLTVTRFFPSGHSSIFQMTPQSSRGSSSPQTCWAVICFIYSMPVRLSASIFLWVKSENQGQHPSGRQLDQPPPTFLAWLPLTPSKAPHPDDLKAHSTHQTTCPWTVSSSCPLCSSLSSLSTKILCLPWSKSVSHSVVSDSATPWTVACQAPLSMEFSRQEY